MARVQPADARDARLLRGSVAFVWLATGVSVLAPSFREVGEPYLDRLGLPHGLMWATCGLEVALGLWVALARPTRWDLALQVALVATFTAILAVDQPLLLAHPFGVLSKNLPLLIMLATAYLLSREGSTPRADALLRLGVAIVWLTEGIFPKLLFQQELELAVVRESGLVPFDASLFLVLMGLAQALAGILLLTLRGRPLRVLLVACAAALVFLPILVVVQDPSLLTHPFGPITKNVPILGGTLVFLRRCSSPS